MLVAIKGEGNHRNVMYCLSCNRTFVSGESAEPASLAYYFSRHRCEDHVRGTSKLKGKPRGSGKKGTAMTTHLSAHLSAVGGAGTVTHSGPSVTVDEEFLLSKYKELGKTIEYLYDDDCNLRVKDSVELVFAKAFKAEAIFEKNKELAAQLASVASVTPVASSMDAGMVLLMLKSDPNLTKFIDEQDTLKRQQAMNPLNFGEDEEGEVVVYTPLEVLRQIAEIAKKANFIRGQSDSFKEQARKKIDDLERALGEATKKIKDLDTERASYQKELRETDDALRLHRDAVKRLTERLSQVADAAPTAPVSVPPGDEAPLAGCKSE